MHCDFLSLSRSIAFDDALEDFAVFLPDLLFLSAETDILLKSLGKPERCLDLGGPAVKPLLLIGNQSIEDLFELVAVSVCKEGEARE